MPIRRTQDVRTEQKMCQGNPYSDSVLICAFLCAFSVFFAPSVVDVPVQNQLGIAPDRCFVDVGLAGESRWRRRARLRDQVLRANTRTTDCSHWLHENDKKIVEHAKGKMKEILEAAGGEDIWKADRTAHLLGTCRMGNDPKNSVVNAD